MTFGERLKALRTKRGLTQKHIAKLLEISQPAYSHYESEKNQPDIETLIKISNIFEVTLDELMGKTDPDKTKKEYQ